MRTAMSRLAGLVLAACLPAPLPAATFTVTTTADSGAGSLRQAILDANANPGTDTIDFAIAGAGIHLISVASTLPIVSDPVLIDGTTQPGYAGSPLIELTGDTILGFGLRISAGASTLRGLAVQGFSTCVHFLTGGGSLVESCYIGTHADGTAGLSSGTGVSIQNSDGNTIGGTTPSSLNVISGNGNVGVLLNGSDGTVIQDNLIGTDAMGLADLGNGSGVSVVTSTNTTVGGTVAGRGNVISANNGTGINVQLSSDTLIAGNLIGTDVTGTVALPNNFGIDSNNLTGAFTIGGITPAERNIVSGNNIGILLNNAIHAATLQNNYIGTDITGTQPIPNNVAMLLNTLDTTDIVIGGPMPGEGNIIAFNEGVSGVHGIWNLGLRVTVRGNSIHDNQGIGLDNGGNGVDPNDPGDVDGGANDGQNFPIVTTVEPLTSLGAGTRVVGVLRSQASTDYVLDFYGSTGCTPRPQDFLEAETYLGAGMVTTDGSGSAVFDVTLPVAIAPGDFVSATATDPDGNTSEFSQRLPFSVVPTSGPAAAGSAITIHGTDFLANAAVTIGGQPATNVNVMNGTTLTAMTPPLTAGTVNDLTVTNTDATTGTLPKAWVSDFLDVPSFHQFHSFVTILVRNAITAGIGGGLYGVDQSTLRQQMAVFLLKAKYGVCYVPPQCAGIFSDVPCPSIFADWIEDLAGQGITGGCGTGVYCPQNPVRRDQMAVFLLKTKYGASYAPPPCTGTFADVACPSTFADWIEELAAETITSGCGGNNYCPLNPNTRGQMAVFIVKTFALQ